MKFARLLAKSQTHKDRVLPGESLQGHTAEVLRAASTLIALRGSDSLQAVALAETVPLSRLERVLWLAAFVHDLGKCSAQFQAMVRHVEQRQLLRHEAASLLLCRPGGPLARFLRPAVGSDEDYALALLAAAGHHRKFPDRAVADDAPAEGWLLTGHPDFAKTLRIAASQRGLGEPPILADLLLKDSRLTGGLRKEIDDCERALVGMITRDDATSRLLAIVKTLLVCADVAGSALPKGGQRPAWLAEQLEPSDASAGLEGIVASRLAGRPLRPFQDAVARSTAPVTLVVAGCGSGKTVAAVAWAARQHATRRLWLTYPTTGTATEGYRDYVHDADLSGKLVHGRADVDYDIFGLRDDADGEGPRDRDRLESLREWGLDLVSCTVDAVLGLIQNNRRGLYAWPSIARGAIVFDEIHSYDDRLFGALLRFLGGVPGVPALLMTASLPRTRLLAIQAIVRQAHSRELAVVDGPADLETIPRYRLDPSIDDAEGVADRLAECGRRGERVLWVSNTVDRCIASARIAATRGSTLRYHSRFKYIDRVARHGRVVEAFRSPAFVTACTTQVAEMSLDLSAELLVTDLAPIPAMIQRLGRLNRRSHPGNVAPVRPFLVIRPDSPLPYDEATMAEAERWLERLSGRDLSQRDLVEAWEQADSEQVAPVESAWLDGGFVTSSQPLREAGVGVTVLLPDDAARVRNRERRSVEVALPMNQPPRGSGWKAWPRRASTDFLLEVPASAISYDPEEGAQWQR